MIHLSKMEANIAFLDSDPPVIHFILPVMFFLMGLV